MTTKFFFKRFFSFVFFFSFSFFMFAAENSAEKKFLKGNLSDKIASLKEAQTTEKLPLAKTALSFSLDAQKILGDDAELSALAKEAVLSIPLDGVNRLTYGEKKDISEKLLQTFKTFSSEEIRIAVLEKVIELRDKIPADDFVNGIHVFLENEKTQSPLVKTGIKTLGKIGNEQSFRLLYNAKRSGRWLLFSNELDASLVSLADKSFPVIQDLIENDEANLQTLFDLFEKNEKISNYFKCEIAENVLSNAIYTLDGKFSRETVAVEMKSLDIIVQNKWTRAAKVVSDYFPRAEKEFESGLMTAEEFSFVIRSFASVSPLDSSKLLLKKLSDLNKQKEAGQMISEELVLSLIDSLGFIGDKSAFDTLLYVTYLNYSDAVIARAREALSRLKW